MFTDFKKIRQEIEDETDRVAGENKGICDEPINLKIHSNRVVDLTMVDLPGITKVPVGDQPEDIEDQIKRLVLSYIQNPNSIILAVTPANTDVATSEALKMALEIDPEGTRTLAVLTKLDLMDEGTDAIDVLNGNVIPVKLGIIGVVNRSQKDIINDKGIEDQLKKEAAFISARYPKIANKSGTPYLAKTMSRLLMHHIPNCLPELKKRVNDKTIEYQTVLRSYGEPLSDKDKTLLGIITSFSQAYCTTIAGTSGSIEGTTICDSTKLYYILHETFEKALSQITPVVKLTKKSLAYALELAMGSGPRLFNDPSFDLPFGEIVKDQLARLENPSLNCVDLVLTEMTRNIHHCGNAKVQSELRRFPRLREKISEVVVKLLQERLVIAKQVVENLVAMEVGYVNKKHPDFNPKAAAESTPLGGSSDMSKSGLSEEALKNTRILENLIHSYFYLIRKSIQDLVPKAIMFHLVNVVKDNIGNVLLSELYRPGSADQLLSENEEVLIGREKALEMLNVRIDCMIEIFTDFVHFLRHCSTQTKSLARSPKAGSI